MLQILPIVQGEKVRSDVAATGFMMNCEPASHTEPLSGQHDEEEVHPDPQSCYGFVSPLSVLKVGFSM